MLLLRDKAKGIIADHVQVASCRRVSPQFCYLILHLSVTDNVACVVGLGLDGSYSP